MAKHQKPSVSFSSIIGLAIGVSCIAISIKLAGNAETFIDVTSFLIIIGGTIGALIVSYPPSRLKTLGPVIKRAFVSEKHSTKDDIDTIIRLSEASRREGLLSLDKNVGKYTDDPFIVKGIMLLVDGVDRDAFRAIMQNELYFMQQRHKKGYGMLGMIASTAPALGLLGTYVGLIPMLLNLENPDLLGPKMAIELVSSFYGAFIAYIIFSPLSKRLKNMSADEITRKELLIEGLTGIQEGKNPRMLREEMIAYMAEKSAEGSGRRRNFYEEGKPELKRVFNYGGK